MRAVLLLCCGTWQTVERDWHLLLAYIWPANAAVFFRAENSLHAWRRWPVLGDACVRRLARTLMELCLALKACLFNISFLVFCLFVCLFVCLFACLLNKKAFMAPYPQWIKGTLVRYTCTGLEWLEGFQHLCSSCPIVKTLFLRLTIWKFWLENDL